MEVSVWHAPEDKFADESSPVYHSLDTSTLETLGIHGWKISSTFVAKRKIYFVVNRGRGA